MASEDVDIEYIIDQRDRFKSEAEESRAKLWASERQVKKLTATVADLQAQLQTTKTALKAAQEALQAERSFITSETHLDAERLASQLNDINKAVQDVTTHILRKAWVDEAGAMKLLNETLNMDHVNAFFGALNDQAIVARLFPLAVASLANGAKVKAFLQPIIQYLLLDTLQYYIFEPFVPGLGTPQDEANKKNYQSLTTIGAVRFFFISLTL